MAKRHAVLVGLFVGLLMSSPLVSDAADNRPQIQHDTDQPIEINADSLEVEQNQQVATFRGNVDAIQGEIRLRADELKVHYRNDDGSTESAAGAAGAIVRIDAVGNVFVSSPTETAQGNTGVYDIDNREITLTGQVVLTRGENVLRGERLVLNMATGRSRIESSGQQGGGRVRAILTPSKKDSKQE